MAQSLRQPQNIIYIVGCLPPGNESREDLMSRLSAILAVSLVAIAALPVAALAKSGKSWTIYGGDQANTRFSTLSQINTSIVNKLKVAWVVQRLAGGAGIDAFGDRRHAVRHNVSWP
jgi:hypothetical protein